MKKNSIKCLKKKLGLQSQRIGGKGNGEGKI
jgi:hypothetical protein